LGQIQTQVGRSWRRRPGVGEPGEQDSRSVDGSRESMYGLCQLIRRAPSRQRTKIARMVATPLQVVHNAPRCRGAGGAQAGNGGYQGSTVAGQGPTTRCEGRGGGDGSGLRNGNCADDHGSGDEGEGRPYRAGPGGTRSAGKDRREALGIRWRTPGGACLQGFAQLGVPKRVWTAVYSLAGTTSRNGIAMRWPAFVPGVIPYMPRGLRAVWTESRATKVHAVGRAGPYLLAGVRR
jgi:hypothetical protein